LVSSRDEDGLDNSAASLPSAQTFAYAREIKTLAYSNKNRVTPVFFATKIQASIAVVYLEVPKVHHGKFQA